MTQPVSWSLIAPGVWVAACGQGDPFTPLTLLNIPPRIQALEAMGQPPLPSIVQDFRDASDARRVVITAPLDKDEAIYGLGLQFLRVNHRNRTRYLRVNSDPRQDLGETHAPVPFYLSSRGYGLLVDTARVVTLYCGGSRVLAESPLPGGDERLEIVFAGEGARLYLFAGETLIDIVRRYNLFCGGGALPPRWGLGFWHRVQSEATDEQAFEEAMNYRRHQVPCDVIGLEPGWQSASYPASYEWDDRRFPRPQAFLARMRGEGLRVNLWEHPYVSPRAAIHAELVPFSGDHTVWGGLVPDYSLPGARKIVQEQHEKQHLDLGVAGYKLDECDGSELTGQSAWIFPVHTRFPSGHDGEQLRQVYGLLLQQNATEMFHRRNQRTYGLVRGSTTGASSFPFVIYSDLYDHRQFVRALCNASFSGLLWTPEVRGAASAEDFVRRIQTACFSPLAMLNAWSDKITPWSFPEVEHIVRRAIQLRMRLIPYLYSAFARYWSDGTPPFRSLALSHAGTSALADIDDQYFVGDALLVAPLFAGEKGRAVTFPPGNWYDFETGERFAGNQVVALEVGIERMPVFVRDGGIVPLMPACEHVPGAETPIELEVRHYGQEAGTFQLFDDDGESYAYEQGAYRWRVLKVEVSQRGDKQGTISPVDEGWTSAYGTIHWSFIGQP